MEKIFNLYIFWDPSPELFSWKIPLLDRPILWYGFFFALGFFLSYFIFYYLLKQFLSIYRVSQPEIGQIAEKTSLYAVIGTILGARFGDVLFYQSLRQYVHDPLGVIRFWEGGLSSHGAVCGIIIALWILYLRIRHKLPMLSPIALMDLIVIPALLAGAFIRIGNFFNQEILGTPTSLPWAITFGHPADGSFPIPRHPVQLYEALGYLILCLVLWMARKNISKMFLVGKTAGIFFIATFSFRFFIEFFKMPQSVVISPDSLLSMGQFLSLPFILFGFFLFFRGQKIPSVQGIKGN